MYSSPFLSTACTWTAPLRARGFTIVEMMVSLALFTIVMTIAAGAFLSLIGGSGQLQSEQTIMTSLNFAMDSMTREIRTGTRYYCGDDLNPAIDDATLSLTRNCPRGEDGISFVESGSSLSNGSTGGRISYYFDSTAEQMMRQIGDDAPQKMLSSDVVLKYMQFFVTGAGNLSVGGDTQQPTVTVILEAKDPNDTTKVYTLETTVTQRELDI